MCRANEVEEDDALDESEFGGIEELGNEWPGVQEQEQDEAMDWEGESELLWDDENEVDQLDSTFSPSSRRVSAPLASSSPRKLDSTPRRPRDGARTDEFVLVSRLDSP